MTNSRFFAVPFEPLPNPCASWNGSHNPRSILGIFRWDSMARKTKRTGVNAALGKSGSVLTGFGKHTGKRAVGTYQGFSDDLSCRAQGQGSATSCRERLPNLR